MAHKEKENHELSLRKLSDQVAEMKGKLRRQRSTSQEALTQMEGPVKLRVQQLEIEKSRLEQQQSVRITIIFYITCNNI